MISLFRGILHPLQVTELKSKGPKEALKWVAKASPTKCQILVAGGDGTVGWILNTIFEMNIQVTIQKIYIIYGYLKKINFF